MATEKNGNKKKKRVLCIILCLILLLTAIAVPAILHGLDTEIPDAGTPQEDLQPVDEQGKQPLTGTPDNQQDDPTTQTQKEPALTTEPTTAKPTATPTQPTTKPAPKPEYSKTLTLSSPRKTSLTVTTPVIEVKGVCDPRYSLTINKMPVKTNENGAFSCLCALRAGANKIVLNNKVKTVQLNVKCNLRLIKQVYPTSDLSLSGGRTLHLKVTALKGAAVRAILGSTALQLTETNSGNKLRKGLEYTEYSADCTLPEATDEKQKLGRLTFYAEYEEHKENKAGAVIYVNALGCAEFLTPYLDHGLGRARICTVTVPHAETALNRYDDDLSYPDYTPLLEGTMDYVIGEKTFSKRDYYLLKSGIKVGQDESDARDGYVLPLNRLSAYSSSVRQDGTDIVLMLDWKVPFRSRMGPQSYKKGKRKHAIEKKRKVGYSVTSFTATYIDFIFDYTERVEETFDISGSPAVKAAEWLGIDKNNRATLRVHFKKPNVFFGYSARYDENNRLVLSFNNPPSAVESSVVMLDAGHGGKDCGTVGTNGVWESDLNLEEAFRVRGELEKRGVKVIMTRTTKDFITLDDRRAMARKAGADVYVSLHHNASGSGQTQSGPEVYYYRANSFDLASRIYEKLVDTWKVIYADEPAMYKNIDDSDVVFYPFRVTRIEECPAVLVETGFLSNPTECAAVCDEDNKKLFAKAIADGICQYLQESIS